MLDPRSIQLDEYSSLLSSPCRLICVARIGCIDRDSELPDTLEKRENERHTRLVGEQKRTNLVCSSRSLSRRQNSMFDIDQDKVKAKAPISPIVYRSSVK